MGLIIKEQIDMSQEAEPTVIHLSKSSMSSQRYSLNFTIFSSRDDLDLSGTASAKLVGTLSTGEKYELSRSLSRASDYKTGTVTGYAYRLASVPGKHVMQIKTTINDKNLHSSKIIFITEDLPEFEGGYQS